MMFIEHVLLVLCFSIVLSFSFVIGAVFAQLIDIDHVFNSTSEISFSEKFNRAFDSLRYVSSNGFFEKGSMGLHRGFLHRPLVFFGFVVFVVCLIGFSVGWFVHLQADGIKFINWGGL